MYLVDPLEVKSFQIPNIEMTKLSTLDKEMTDILQNNSLSETEKLIRYDQALLKFKNLLERQKEPFKMSVMEPTDINIENETPVKGTSNDYKGISLLSIDNAKIRSHAHTFLKYLDDKKIIKWDEKGQIIDQSGIPIANSHIVDLVEDAVRRTKKNAPAGTISFYRELKQHNVPKSFIKNVNRRSLLEKFISPTSHVDTGSSPIVSGPKRKRRREETPTKQSMSSRWINLSSKS